MAIGVGIIGAGRMGEIHSETLRKIDGTKVVAVADSMAEKAKNFGEKYGLPYYEDYRIMMEKEEMDAIICCLPHTLHADCVIAAAYAGKHILCEKPIETTIEKMDAMIDACEKNKVLFMPGHTHRFLPDNVRVKQLIDEGAIGTPIMAIDRIMMMGFEPGYPAWMGKQSLGGGGILMNNGVHSVDRMRYWLGAEVTQVFAKCGRYVQNIETEDNGMMFLSMSNGTYATSELSWSTPKPAGTCLAQIIGTLGVIEIKTWNSIRIVRKNDTEWKDVPIPEGNAFVAELTDFIDAIRLQRPAFVSPHDGRAAVAAILAAYESSKTGQVVLPR